MDKPLSADLFPSGFPSELVSAAFVASNEAAWRPALAARSVEWLGTHGYAVLRTELWLNSRLSCLMAFPRSPRTSSAFQSTRSRVLDTTYFFAASIDRAKGSIQAGIQAGLAPICATGRHADSIIS